jgi:hypothetical protein
MRCKVNGRKYGYGAWFGVFGHLWGCIAMVIYIHRIFKSKYLTLPNLSRIQCA